MTKWLEIEGKRVGKVMDFTYTRDEQEQPIFEIPVGNDSVYTTFNIKDPEEVARFIEAYRKVFTLGLTDADIAREYIAEGGDMTAEAMDFLNVLTITYVRKGKNTFLPMLVVFEDGSHLAWK